MAIITTPAAGVSPYQTADATPTVLRAGADGSTVLADAAAATATVSELAAANANTLVVVSGQAALNSLITSGQPGVFDGANVTINLEEQNFTTTNQVTSTTNYPSGGTGEIQYNSGANSFASSSYFTYTSGNVVTPGIRTDGYYYANGSPFSGGGSGNYSNSNVASFLAAFGSNVVSTTGNITAGNLDAVNLVINRITSDDSSFVTIEDGLNVTSGLISAPGNISLTAGSSTWAFDNTGTLTVPGDIVSANLIGTSSVSAAGNVFGNNINANYNLSAFGNVYANSAILTFLASTANLQVSGTANVGALSTVGSVSANGNITSLSAMYSGNGATWQTQVALANVLFVGADVGDEYIQAAMVETGGNGSADWVSYSNNGNTDSGWIDMGMTGNTFNDPNYELTDPNDGYILVQGTNVSGTPLGGNLVLATGDIGLTHDIVFATGGFTHANIKARLIDTTGEFSVVGNIAANNLSGTNLVINSITSDDSTFVTIEDGLNVTSGLISAPESMLLTAGANTWTFDTTGNLTLPGSLVLSPNTIITGAGASPAPSINGFGTINAITFSASGNVTGGNISTAGLVKTGSFVTGTIPAAAGAGAGARSFVTDADSVTFGNLYVGGAANAMPVWSNGTNWYIG